MSINQDSGNGRCKIIPSARRGIHRTHIVTDREGMVRYGDDLSSDEECSGRRNAGTDEVDNVMSKCSYSSSPLVMRKAKRNSMTPPDELHTDDWDDNALAKSLPATLPSYSHCSDDLGDWSPSFGNRLNSSAESASTSRSRGNRSIDSRNSSFPTRSPNLSPRLNQPRNNHRNREKHKEGTILMSLIALLGIFSFAYYYDLFNSTFDSDHEKYDELRFHSDLSQLGAKYKVDDDSVLKLQSGISTIFKSEDTSCFIFVYDSMREDFDEIDFDGFVNNVASNTAKFLRNDSRAVDHVVVESCELKMRSHSQLVQAYREETARAGVLLVRGVEHVPSPLAMAFHYYCDEYNPLVKKSAIFFTLNTAKCHNAGEKSSYASVEKCLRKKWDTVDSDLIGPLLTRVVNVLLDVTNH